MTFRSLGFILFLGLLPRICAAGTNEDLFGAIAKGDAAAVKALLAAGADAKARDSEDWSALFRAIDGRHVEIIRSLLAAGADPNMITPMTHVKFGTVEYDHQSSPLHKAVDMKEPAIAQALLKGGADPNVKVQFMGLAGLTPLMLAAMNGHPGLVKVLSAYADPDIMSPDGKTALGMAEDGERAGGPRRSEYAQVIRILQTPSPQGPGGMTKEELRLMMSEAVREAGPGKAPQAAPAVQPAAVSREEMRRMMDEAVGKAARSAPQEAPKEKIPASDVDRPRYRSPELADNFAVVVGIEKYAAVPDARFAERDAAAVKAHLLAMGYPERNIISLAGAQATRTGIAKNIETWLPRNVNRNSTVLFYYSGHGAPDAKNGQAYLLPWDGDPQFLEDTGYPTQRLYEKLNALEAGSIVVIMDACFSGAGGRSVLAKGARPLVTRVNTTAGAGGKTLVFSAAAADEIAGTEESQGHGLFTYHFLKGLNGAAPAGDGRITAKSLYDYLLPKVKDAARRQNRDQTPQLLPPASGPKAALILR